MIDIQTLERLKSMRLSRMAEYFENHTDQPGIGPLTGPELVKQATTGNINADVTGSCTDSAAKRASPSPVLTSPT